MVGAGDGEDCENEREGRWRREGSGMSESVEESRSMKERQVLMNRLKVNVCSARPALIELAFLELEKLRFRNRTYNSTMRSISGKSAVIQSVDNSPPPPPCPPFDCFFISSNLSGLAKLD